ncbi:MAG: hypothetical protein JXB62_17190 [Pirellulales bacterium]|nr:hypothetical protein [Pirellulales bacterium]
MSRFQHAGLVGLSMTLLLLPLVGCREAEPPAPPGITAAQPAVTPETDAEPGLEPEAPMPAETPEEPEQPAEMPEEPEQPAEMPEEPEQPAETPEVLEQPAEMPEQPPQPEQPAETPEEPSTDMAPANVGQDEPKEPDQPDETAAAPPAVLGNLAPIPLELPAPAFRGTPVPLDEPNVEKPRGAPRPAFLAPAGTVNLSRGKPVSSSDPAPVSGELDYVADGDKEASDFGYLELRPGTEWIQVDLGQKATIYAVVLWHNHAEARVYRDVVVQISDDPDCLDAQTVYNNDYDNTSGLAIGTDMGYVETAEGRLIDCRGSEGRYVRFYSRGSNIDEKNHYTEVEVFGRPIE